MVLDGGPLGSGRLRAAPSEKEHRANDDGYMLPLPSRL